MAAALLLICAMLFCAAAAAASGIETPKAKAAPGTIDPGPTVAPTPEPSETVPPIATQTPEPTETPKPTNTPKPSSTPKPTETPKPTDEPLEITTSSTLPKGTVGKEYSIYFEANYADAEFVEYMSSSGPNQLGETGLTLNRKTGNLSGTPKKPGTFSFYICATSDSAAEDAYKKFTITIEKAQATPAPTGTPVVTATPAANTPAPTGAVVVTPAPTVAPTQQGSYIAYPMWDRAADTIQKVEIDRPFDIVLVEGISEHLSFSELYGNLPATVEFVNDISVGRTCSIRGYLPAAGSTEFAIAFGVRGGRTLMLNFRLIAEAEPEPPITAGFPEGHHLVPFGGAPTAMLPPEFITEGKRKEDEV